MHIWVILRMRLLFSSSTLERGWLLSKRWERPHNVFEALRKGEKAVSYKSIFVFDDGSNWASDWSHYDLANLAPRPGFGLFTRFDQSYGGAMPANRWHGVDNTLTIFREDHEDLTDLFQLVNTAPLGGPSGRIWQQIMNQAEAFSHTLYPLWNAFFQPPIRFSYAYGQHAVGPGNEHGGLPSIPEHVKDQPLLTLKVSLHINTPPGMSSIDADLVFYLALRIENGHVVAEFIGVAHPWRFHGDGYGAYQNEINQGLGRAANDAVPMLNMLLDLLQAYRGSQLYLVPGLAQPRLEEGKPLRGSVRSAMTLTLVP